MKKTMTYNIVDVLNRIYNYVSIIDKNGDVVFVNNAIHRYGRDKTDVLGKNIKQLLEEGYMRQSIFEKCVKSGKEEAMVQQDEDGIFLDWASGYYNDSGELEYVVCTEWDLKHLNQLQNLLVFKNTLTIDENKELDYYRDKNIKIPNIICESENMSEVINIANHAAETDATVLLQGDSGTGKGIIAKYIHYRSLRSKGPLIEINCNAIPESLIESELFGSEKGAFTGASEKGKKGVFEIANNGTLFLDEIGDMPIHMQSKLLKVLQEKKLTRIGGTTSKAINPRIIAATNIDLKKAVENKEFRLDLYYRLNVIPIYIPNLKERKNDIPKFIETFSHENSLKYKKQLTFTKGALALFQNYSWPGNVRELENLIERLYIMSKDTCITSKAIRNLLPGMEAFQTEDKVLSEMTLKESVDEYEKNLIMSKLDNYQNIRQFAELLGIEKSTLYRKLRKYDIYIGSKS